MRKLLHAHDADAIRVPRQITEDLIAGMSHDEIAKKKYRYTVEVFFYTQPEYIPTDDPHWSSVSLLNLNQFIDKEDDNDDDNGLIVKSKIITN
jgi:hypothetical protein